MLVNQRTHNLYISITANFTLAHLKKTQEPGNKFSKKVTRNEICIILPSTKQVKTPTE